MQEQPAEEFQLPAPMSVLSAAFLVLCLFAPAVLPEIASVGYYIMMAAGLVVLCLSPDRAELVRRPAVLVPLTGGVVLAIAFALTAESGTDIAAALIFAPLYLVAPGLALLRAGGKLVNPTTVGAAAISGVVLAAVFTVTELSRFPDQQVGWSVNNPIHFGTVAVTLGFVSLAGLHSRHMLLRVACCFGPVLGLAITWVAGTQGPLLGGLAMAAFSLVIVADQFASRRAASVLVAVMLICFAAASPALWQVYQGYNLPAADDLLSFLRSGQAFDSSVNERVLIYSSGVRAWLASPLLGHGAIDLVGQAAQYVPEGMVLRPYDHLHNDIIDFAVSAGVLGLLAYAAFVAAMPLAAWALGPETPAKKAAILVGLPVSLGYVVMGLSNAVFGISTQTVLYGAVLIIVSHLSRTPEGSGGMQR
jgi:O-antigen ligase